MRQFYVYLLTNKRHIVLYTGVTNDLVRRTAQHRMGLGGRFSKRYQLHKVVYFEVFGEIASGPLVPRNDRRALRSLAMTGAGFSLFAGPYGIRTVMPSFPGFFLRSSTNS